MIRKTYIASALTLSVTSFSFYPMKNIYYYPDQLSYNYSSQKIEPYTEEKSGRGVTFLYDEHTSIQLYETQPKRYSSGSIECTVELPPDKFYASPFINCDFNENNIKWNTNRVEIDLIKKHKTLLFPKLIYEKRLPIYQEKTLLEVSNNIQDTGYSYCSKIIKSKLGITINNAKQKVTLIQNDKSIELTAALIKYFDFSLNQENFINALAQSNREQHPNGFSKNMESVLNLANRLNNPTLTETELNCLKNSTILAVWFLIPQQVEPQNSHDPQPNQIESQLVGLAKDKNDQLFHWTTDLKNDISVLMNY